ncbi:hypothetical protein ABZ714_31170 [Streptomyces sp. NPDC006798]|uniref:hypothetical protein n=1 Tax=Streptomyces sp. NPDC006798 TaxID=3155462 RepID=UPI0033E57FC0
MGLDGEVLVPAGAVTRVDPAGRTVCTGVTRDRIRGEPAFHRARAPAAYETRGKPLS